MPATLTKLSIEPNLAFAKDARSALKLMSLSNSGVDQELSLNKKKFDLKLWQIALLLGIPSALIAFYLYYRKSKRAASSSAKSTKDINHKNEIDLSKQKSKNNSDTNVASSSGKSSSSSSKTESKPKSKLELAVEVKNQGNEHFQSGKFEEAVKCYSDAINLCPTSDKEELPKFYQNRAAAYENLKLYEKVIEDCTAALKLDPNYTKALTRRAKAFESLEKYQEAFEDYTALCILQKFSSSSMASADRLVKKIGEKMGKEIFKNRASIAISQHFVNNFYIGLNNDIIFKNQKFFDQVLEDTNSSEMLKALMSFNSGNYNECIESCTAVINKNERYVLEARNLRGSLYMLRCQYKEAKQDFDTILNDSSPSSTETESEATAVASVALNRLKSNTYIKLTALNLQNSEENEAFDNYEKAIEIDPENEDIYCNRAQVYAMKGKFDECFRDFEKCIQLNPNHKIAKLQKAFFEFRQFFAQLSLYIQATGGESQQNSLLRESKELKSETAKLEKLIEEYSDVPEAYNLYAQILSEQENYEKAERYYKVALERDPNNAALLVQRALNIMTWKNEFDEPIRMLNDAIKIDETCEFAYETLATIEIQRGNLQRAVELFEKAIQLTRSEDSLTNLCCMLVGAKTQFKILHQYSGNSNVANSFNF